jgi:hypothetical protein
MNPLRFIAGLGGVLLLELWVSVILTSRPLNLAKYPYRLEERNAAGQAYNRDHAPEKETAFRQELRLADRRILWRQLIPAGAIFSAFLVLDGIVVYGWKHAHERQTVA